MNGNFWLFGGQGGALNQGDLNYLWEYNPATGEWVWMSGSNAVYPVYGTLGVPAPDNQPGGREGSVGWTDNKEDLWLFGGYLLNDLWKFHIPNNEWTWMGGSQPIIPDIYGTSGIYGTLGKPDAANIPGSRWLAVSWTDKVGNLWLFGGEGNDSAGTSGFLNDLWMFDIASNQWKERGDPVYTARSAFLVPETSQGAVMAPSVGRIRTATFGSLEESAQIRLATWVA
jgi:hypothetical protein